jgi:hypothetical protein
MVCTSWQPHLLNSLARDDGCYDYGMTTVVSFVSLWFCADFCYNILISLHIQRHNGMMNFSATMGSMLEYKV